MADTKHDSRPGRYDFGTIETRWQRRWDEEGTFRTLNPGDPGADTSKPKYYILDFFPYPSGAGLHVGHPLGYCATDIIARYKRMCGYNVLHPMGFDSFGLPAEQYAIETNVHPAATTQGNVEVYRRQLKLFGFSYDWTRELTTSDPSYYKFTQWMFARMFESWYDDQARWTDANGKECVGRARPISGLVAELESGRWGVDASLDLVRELDGPDRREWGDLTRAQQRQVLDNNRLAYLADVLVNWCPGLGTVLANEEVDSEGRSDRGKHPVFRRPLRQWMLRITKYAQRLVEDLDKLDWPEPIRLMQRNWVGKSTGAEVVFPLAGKWTVENGRWKCLDANVKLDGPLSYNHFPHAIRVYTTRPDTLFGATYMVLAPEHELVERITAPQQQGAVDQYVAATRNRSDLDRTADTKEKTGVFTGAYAINPVNGQPIPIWVADYVLMGYGTGAIMAVPGGDTRDFEFACTFDLPIVSVVRPSNEWIEERIEAMARGIDQRTASGFDQVASEFPELGELVAEHRARSEGLGDKTTAVLREKIGLDRLADHVVQHPKAWGEAFTGEGVSVNSPGSAELDVPGGVCRLDGLPTPEAKAKIIQWLEENAVGRGAVNYKIRDWIFSRQKYWGEPFPVLHAEDGETIAVGDDELPVELPAMEDFKPTPASGDVENLPEPPLGRAREWVKVERDGRSYVRDLNTMPQWAGSCWYYLRFIDPHNPERFCDPEAERYWMPIDLYMGGAEHAVLHLLYARFWHKVLYDLEYVSTVEPFAKLFNQGMIQGFAYRNRVGLVVGPDEVEEHGDDDCRLKATGQPVTRIIAKMSKSLKNVVSPDEIIRQYGADTFRLYEMYMGPLDAAKPWNTRDVPGLFKLCQRVWRLVVDEQTGELSSALTEDDPGELVLRALHKTVKRVTEDLEQLKLNTAIAALFDFVNVMTPLTKRPRSVIEPFVLLLSPFAPHLGEELWHRLGHTATLAYEPWPTFDPNLACDDEVEVAVQVQGKIKARLMVATDADEETIRTSALADDRVVKALEGKTVRKVIVVKGRLVNIVAN
jgi:leucyl-tRNA synthetase